MRLKANGLAALAIVATWAAFFARQLFTDGVPFRRDALDLYLPVRHFLHESLLAGRLPEWFPYEGIGVPFIGQIVTATFHPLTWVLLPFDPAVALKLNVLLAYLAALGGGYRLARAVGASRPGAFCGGAALAFCGYALSMSDNLPYLVGLATLPWVAWAALGVARTGSGGYAAALAVAIALVALGGDAQAFVLTPLLVVAAAVAGRAGPRALFWMTVGIALGIGLAAVEIAPATVVFAESARLTSGFIFDKGRFWALHPWRLFELLVPNFLPAGHHREASRLLFGQPFRWATVVFAGGIALTLAAGAFRSRRMAVTFGLLAALALWLALGSRGGAFDVLVQLAPPLASFRFPEKYLALFEVALVPLVALGADAALAHPRRWGARFLGFAFLAIVGALAVQSPLLGGMLNRSRVPGSADSLELAALIAQGWSGGLATTAAFLAGAGLLLLIPFLRNWAPLTLPLLLVFELWWSNGDQFPTVPQRLVNPQSSAFAKALAPQEGEPPRRVISDASPRYGAGDDGPSDEAWVRSSMNRLLPDVGAISHVSTIGVSVLPAQSQRTRETIGPLGARANELGPIFGACARVVDLPPQLRPAKSSAAPLATDAESSLALQKIECRPPAYFAAAHPPTQASVADELASLKPEEAVWEGGLSAVPSVSALEWKKYQPGEMELSVATREPAAVVVSEGFAPGWTASIDGKPAAIHPANGIAMAIEVGEGSHAVRFAFHTPRLELGEKISEGSLVLCLLLALVGLRNRRRESEEEPLPDKATGVLIGGKADESEG